MHRAWQAVLAAALLMAGSTHAQTGGSSATSTLQLKCRRLSCRALRGASRRGSCLPAAAAGWPAAHVPHAAAARLVRPNLRSSPPPLMPLQRWASLRTRVCRRTTLACGRGRGRTGHSQALLRKRWVGGCCRACLSRTAVMAAVRTLPMHGYRKPQCFCQRALSCGLLCMAAQLSRLVIAVAGLQVCALGGRRPAVHPDWCAQGAGLPSPSGPLQTALPPLIIAKQPSLAHGTACENNHMPCSCRQLQLLGVRWAGRRALRPRLDAGQPRRHQHHGAALRVCGGGPAGRHLPLVSNLLLGAAGGAVLLWAAAADTLAREACLPRLPLVSGLEEGPHRLAQLLWLADSGSC